jgi:trk system potassium uptake protein TrkA
MDIVICGAGDVGTHAAESLASSGHGVTVIDIDPARLGRIEETLDVRSLRGNCAEAPVLEEAGVRGADMVVAATGSDEVNLLVASLARGLGARKTIARVHHNAFVEGSRFDYGRHFGIDLLICPEHSAALAIARSLRNPGAVAIETFSRGRIEMQEFVASEKGTGIGKRLMDVHMPSGTRLAMIGRKGTAIIPEATSVVVPRDTLIMVGNAGAFDEGRKLFQADRPPRRKAVLMGGTPIAVWLCRALREHNFSIRLFEPDRQRAQALADSLDWVTVIQADPTDRSVFDEEHLGQADVFLCLLDDDEDNIIGGVLAKTRGVSQVVTVVQQTKYLDVIYDIGVDLAFSPRMEAAREINAVLDDSPLRHLGSLAEGYVDVFRVKVGDGAPVAGKPLREVHLAPDWVVAAVERDRVARVPGAEDVLQPGDVALVVGRGGGEDSLRSLFSPGRRA